MPQSTTEKKKEHNREIGSTRDGGCNLKGWSVEISLDGDV